MKVFFATTVIFLLLLGVILGNTLFINSLTSGLEELLTALPPCHAADAALAEAESYWQDHRWQAGLSISSDVILLMDDHLAELRAAVSVGDAAGFEQARAVALTAVRAIRDAQRLTLDNLL